MNEKVIPHDSLPFVQIINDIGMLLVVDDAALAREYWRAKVHLLASDLGLAEIGDDFMTAVAEQARHDEASSSDLSALEVAQRRILDGRLEEGGRLIRQHLISGAMEIQARTLAQQAREQQKKQREWAHRGGNSRAQEAKPSHKIIFKKAVAVLQRRKSKFQTNSDFARAVVAVMERDPEIDMQGKGVQNVRKLLTKWRMDGTFPDHPMAPEK